MKKLSFYFLRFIEKTGPFYFILSFVFYLSGFFDEKVLGMIVVCSIVGIIMVVTDELKKRK
ncbi:hypothetical protein [Candidatus Pantoea multigeneris]|uniref:Uncharacterized protein n=1 Tax=Candidatus Pantoea multigeneris TaxID=2608357 RepID=A0ABX0R8B9_9GAMM|nr:hypothetical protein [Pantoea multigeneris]NIF21622.1 hypothetical protein [Pantoea multigeneris]